jgi:glutamate racemase
VIVGVFDSGVGGLTVLKQLVDRYPHASTIYLGDTARVPYGTKSNETVVRYAAACARVLMARGIELLVVACNTASAFALDHLKKSLPIPVIGVVEPGARAGVAATKTGRIGVIGTAGTIRSEAYQRAIHALRPDAAISVRACPLFVPLAEEGWTQGGVPAAIAKTYLSEMRNSGVDTLVLGCTHYPLLKPVIASVMGPDVMLIDSAEAVAGAARDFVPAAGAGDEKPHHQFLSTDDPVAFRGISERFLGHPIEEVEWVDVA